MFAQVARDQFEIKEDAIIHTPTGAEFTPVMGHAESVLIWTGEIGNRLWSGEVYRYADSRGFFFNSGDHTPRI